MRRRSGLARRGLQVAIALAGLVPVAAGLAGVLSGPAMLDSAGTASLDSHYRYLSGLLLAIGLVFWASIPRIEQHTGRVRLLTLVVFVGGLGRLVGALELGWPPLPMLGAFAMELVVTPLLCLWQAGIAERRGTYG
jgi:hypothetical protein